VERTHASERPDRLVQLVPSAHTNDVRIKSHMQITTSQTCIISLSVNRTLFYTCRQRLVILAKSTLLSPDSSCHKTEVDECCYHSTIISLPSRLFDHVYRLSERPHDAKTAKSITGYKHHVLHGKAAQVDASKHILKSSPSYFC